MRAEVIGKNEFGIVDHYLISPKGAKVYVPMRVVPKGSGSEVIFTVFRQSWMTEKSFANDIGLVKQDLKYLKILMERK